MPLINIEPFSSSSCQLDKDIYEKVCDFFREDNLQRYIAKYAFEGVEPKFSRAAAWNHLYVFIQDHLDKLKDAKPDSDLYSRACAELAAYLAAFGMYRYSTKLMMTNKVIFAPLLHSLIQTASQQNISPYQDRFSQDQIKALIDTSWFELMKAAEAVPLAVTDTLTSKILHGTFGCTPAFDRFFVEGVRVVNKLERTCFFSEEEISERKKRALCFPTNIGADFGALQVWAFDPKNQSQLRKLSKGFPILLSRQKIVKGCKTKTEEIEMPYPTMRIVDQVFWGLGRHIEKR